METQVQQPTQENFYFNLQSAIEIAREMTIPRAQDILLKYIERYYDGGEITPINVHKSAKIGASLISYCEYNEGSKHNIANQDGTFLPQKTQGDRLLVGKGILSEDTKWVDTDPYPKAGGYRGGVAEKGSECNVWLSYDYTGFKLEIEAPVNITKCHYDINFYGNSTGGCTKTYQKGQKVESHYIAAGETMHVIADFLDEGRSINFERIVNFVLVQDKERNKPSKRIR